MWTRCTAYWRHGRLNDGMSAGVLQDVYWQQTDVKYMHLLVTNFLPAQHQTWIQFSISKRFACFSNADWYWCYCCYCCCCCKPSYRHTFHFLARKDILFNDSNRISVAWPLKWINVSPFNSRPYFEIEKKREFNYNGTRQTTTNVAYMRESEYRRQSSNINKSSDFRQ